MAHTLFGLAVPKETVARVIEFANSMFDDDDDEDDDEDDDGDDDEDDDAARDLRFERGRFSHRTNNACWKRPGECPKGRTPPMKKHKSKIARRGCSNTNRRRKDQGFIYRLPQL